MIGKRNERIGRGEDWKKRKRGRERNGRRKNGREKERKNRRREEYSIRYNNNII